MSRCFLSLGEEPQSGHVLRDLIRRKESLMARLAFFEMGHDEHASSLNGNYIKRTVVLEATIEVFFADPLPMKRLHRFSIV